METQVGFRKTWILVLLCLRSIVVSALTSPTTAKGAALTGNWKDAKSSLRSPECCVVTVDGLETHLQVLQKWMLEEGPLDLDLRKRIRSSNLERRCLDLQHAVQDTETIHDDVTTALAEIVQGVTLLADGPLEAKCEDVFLRIVCASNYKARDPMFHTDKAPLRAYVTLCGVGTEIMTRTCSPLEYAKLRTLGSDIGFSNLEESLRKTDEGEFIVMKGDYYVHPQQPNTPWTSRVWTRASACVHRSPPGTGGRRIILSLDLADGDDDREWFQIHHKREWRSGMTQRKSRLVA